MLAKNLARYALQTSIARSYVIIDDGTAYGQGLSNEFEKAVISLGGRIIGREFTSNSTTDFSRVLGKIKQQKPDAIFYGGMDTSAGPLLRQMREMQIDAKLIGGDGICSGELPQLAGGLTETRKVICAEAGGVEGEYKQVLMDFGRKFKSKFNVDVQIFAPYTYDATMVLVAAMEKAGSSDPAVYLPVLARTSELKGVTGSISFDDKGDLKSGAISIYTYASGRRTFVAVAR